MLANKDDTEMQHMAQNIQSYGKDSWIVRFHSLAGKNVKKIIIVSDFINKI